MLHTCICLTSHGLALHITSWVLLSQHNWLLDPRCQGEQLLCCGSSGQADSTHRESGDGECIPEWTPPACRHLLGSGCTTSGPSGWSWHTRRPQLWSSCTATTWCTGTSHPTTCWSLTSGRPRWVWVLTLHAVFTGGSE